MTAFRTNSGPHEPGPLNLRFLAEIRVGLRLHFQKFDYMSVNLSAVEEAAGGGIFNDAVWQW